jgi:hypothetical protein
LLLPLPLPATLSSPCANARSSTVFAKSKSASRAKSPTTLSGDGTGMPEAGTPGGAYTAAVASLAALLLLLLVLLPAAVLPKRGCREMLLRRRTTWDRPASGPSSGHSCSCGCSSVCRGLLFRAWQVSRISRQ